MKQTITLQKRLGAFFTPDKYVKISTKYLRNAIKRVPKGYDYIILDRCAGTGNLQKFLTDEELSHCILNTYIYSEWSILKKLYEKKARYIIPHTKDSDGDALTKEFAKLIRKIINKEKKKAKGKLVIIGLENPPYSTPGAEATRKNGKTWKQTSWVKEQMKKAKVIKGYASSNLYNQFIFSMFRHVDEYILYSPIKYWKTQHLLDGKFNEGYLCNRKLFHATESAISLISWSKEKVKNDVLDVDSDLGKRKLKKVKNGANILLPTSKNRKVRNKFAGLILGNGSPDGLHGHLVTTVIKHDEVGKVRELNDLNVQHLLPLFVANCYKPKDYTEKEVIMKSGDGGTKYQQDKAFLDDCFVWSCLSNQNKCISNKQVKNELCLGQNTKADKLLNISSRHFELLKRWCIILDIVKRTKEYKKSFNYGLHQIDKDINIKVPTGNYNKKGEPIIEFKYSNLNHEIKEFKKQLEEFYDKYITPKLFEYELLK